MVPLYLDLGGDNRIAKYKACTQEVNGKECEGGKKHAVAHGARCCGSDEDAVEQEGGEAANWYNERPEQVGVGSVDEGWVVAKDT